MDWEQESCQPLNWDLGSTLKKCINPARNPQNQSDHPQKGYFAIKKSVDDQLILPKLPFFSYVAGIVEPFLKTCETDNPMIPYLYSDLKAIVKQLLELIVESNVIDVYLVES